MKSSYLLLLSLFFSVSTFSQWKIVDQVDEFGDKTGVKVAVTYSTAILENSIKQGAKSADIVVTLTKFNSKFVLYIEPTDYGIYKITPGSPNGTNWICSIKDGIGIKQKLNAYQAPSSYQ